MTESFRIKGRSTLRNYQKLPESFESSSFVLHRGRMSGWVDSREGLLFSKHSSDLQYLKNPEQTSKQFVWVESCFFFLHQNVWMVLLTLTARQEFSKSFFLTLDLKIVVTTMYFWKKLCLVCYIPKLYFT